MNIETVTTVLSAAAVLIGVWRMLAKTEDRLEARISSEGVIPKEY